MVQEDVLAELATGERCLLKELPTSSLPKLPGIYALWHDDVLLYAGMSRVDPRDTSNPQATGVPGRPACPVLADLRSTRLSDVSVDLTKRRNTQRFGTHPSASTSA